MRSRGEPLIHGQGCVGQTYLGVNGKSPCEKIAEAIQLRTHYIVMQVIPDPMTAKKTRINMGSLAPAAGVPPI